MCKTQAPTPAAVPIRHPLFSNKHIHTWVSQLRNSSLTGPLSLVAGHNRFHWWSNRTVLVQSHTCLPDRPTHSFCWSWSKAGGNYRSKTLPKVEHEVISLFIYTYIFFLFPPGQLLSCLELCLAHSPVFNSNTQEWEHSLLDQALASQV